MPAYVYGPEAFLVNAINVEGKPFTAVDRIECGSEDYPVRVTLDVNSEGYTIKTGERLSIALALSVQHDGRLDKSSYPLPTDRPTLLDQYEYAMHGTVYEVKPKTDGKVEVSCSFGGLLMLIVGESQHVSRLEPDMEVYFLCKKLEVVL